jgi:hypothetical protein
MIKPFGINFKQEILDKEKSVWENLVKDSIKYFPNEATQQYIMFFRDALLDLLIDTIDEVEVNSNNKEEIYRAIEDEYSSLMLLMLSKCSSFNEKVEKISQK